MVDEERAEAAKSWDSRTPLERFDNLSRQEQSAFCAFFRGGHAPQLAWRGDTETLTPVHFGKAECEWVPLDFWRYKLPGLRLIEWHQDPPKVALGMVPGSVFVKTQIVVTKDGLSAYDGHMQRSKDHQP